MDIDEKVFEELQKQMELNYDAICYRVLVSLYRRAKPTQENGNIIALKNFDFGNEEHLFVLAIARALSGVIEGQVSVKTNPIRFWYENSKIKVEGSKLVKYKKEFEKNAIEPDEVLTEFREMAENLCGEDFDFSDIYDEYYM